MLTGILNWEYDILVGIRQFFCQIALMFAFQNPVLSVSKEEDEINEKATRLIDTYGNAILRMAYSYMHNMSDAEDILQETLIQYLKASPDFRDENHEKAWLLRVCGNISKNRIKYNALRDTDELQDELQTENKEDLSFVWDAVKKLPQKYREVIHLFYYENLSTKEISSILDRKESTVRSDLKRGREALKQILKEDYDFAGE